ncbi:hypothetical protein [Nitrosomonas aestuarii]|uniref:hypothetical protein n=1 Tax=Nitrosomonas aestuarii TaxID=52441 RepID=UPI000D2FC68D|nr:hypothetical protein [Nitrosomonas aestuarii]PTN12166.1 hypothetical protein C8R11_105128 [Nitrosomonas aestuarii]
MNNMEKGIIYLWALFAVTVAGVVMAGTGQLWQTKIQREKEMELLFIGDQFRKAIMSYHSNQLTGIRQYPESLDQLLEDKRGPVIQRHLRKIYIDPMTMTDEWGLVEEDDLPQQQVQGQNSGQNSDINSANNTSGVGSNLGSSGSKGIVGVYSLSSKTPRKKENFPDHFAKFTEAETYQDWQFVHTQQTGNDNNASRQTQQGASGTGSSPFGTPGGTSRRPGQGTQGGTPASPFAPSSSPPAGAGQNPFAQ